jgi:hypothetical protein
MKRDVIKMLLNREGNVDNNVKKKILIGLGILAFLGVCAIGVIGYVGVKAAGYLISIAPSKEQVGTLTQQLGEQGNVLLTTTKVASCLDVVQSHMNLNAWLIRPMSVNVANIYGTCIGNQATEPAQNEEKKGEEHDQSNF